MAKLFTTFYKILHSIFMLITLIAFLAMLLVFLVLTGRIDEVPTPMANSNLLIINLNGVLLEQASPQSFRGNEHYARDIARVLAAAADDNRIDAVFINLNGFAGATIGAVQTVISAINIYRESGKPLYGYAGNVGTAGYSLLTFADVIWLNPFGSINLSGVAMQNLYFAEALQRYGLTAYVSRAGSYKSAVEPFLANQMTEGNHALYAAFMQDYWQAITANILAGQNNLNTERFNHYVDNRPALLVNAGNNAALLALEHGLVDHIASYDDMWDQLEDLLLEQGIDANYLAHSAYLTGLRRHGSNRLRNWLNRSTPQIAVIHATGTIMNGAEVEGVINATSYANIIDDLAHNNRVAAIVIRVNSGGGEVMASWQLYEAILKAKEHKPVIITMSGAAASGAYLFSLAADEIWAEPITLTGSIGVFNYFVAAHNLLAEHGIYSDGLATTNHAYPLSPFSQPTTERLSLMQSSVDFTYQNFLQLLIDNGRAGNLMEADELAQGRIFSGPAALELGLVDNIGGLAQAIEQAANLAELNYYNISYHEAQASFGTSFVRRLLAASNLNLPVMASPFNFNLYNQESLMAIEPFRVIYN
ncbi:MAG: signal peptide peptidase SppA [Spirochaetaceae bacterium]|nr:signal peptide peptidase SppA [Spirochaetaceae bacterium]